MIEVFKTNVECPDKARELVNLLLYHFPGNRINFDMHDCDKVLRIEGKHFIPGRVMEIVKENGFACNVLE